MDNIRRIIQTLFCDANPEDIINSLNNYRSNNNYSCNITSDWLENILENKQTGYTKDEIRFIVKTAKDSWLRDLNRKEDFGESVFFILLHFTAQILREESDEPIVRFEQLLRWRELSYLIGEDVLTTAYLANKDIDAHRSRNYFSWRAVLDNDNKMLRNLLDKGTTELHFHLWGSTMVFDINWISLMNDVTDRKCQFDNLKNPKMPKTLYGFGGILPLSLYEQCIKAAALRLYLYKVLYEYDDVENMHILDQIINAPDWVSIKLWISELQTMISYHKYVHGYDFTGEIIDYAIPLNLTQKDDEKGNSNLILCGERKLLYDAFTKCFKNKYIKKSTSDNDKFDVYLYSYLVIKNNLRQEIIQVNNRIGFANFADYQDRKGYFIKDASFYSTLTAPTAILSTLNEQKVNYLEARICPKSSPSDLINTISDIDKSINKVHGDKFNHIFEQYFYILHFIKRDLGENKIKDHIILSKNPRNWKLREVVKEQAIAYNEVRKSNHATKKRIIGVDAANFEIGFRPEIFAQAYRFLRNYSYQSPHEYIVSSTFKRIGFTYHAGEDFLDIVDGLRAIDETIIFLNFTSGDRLGHALALGINAFEYYKLKRDTLVMPLQDYLDNIAWILYQIKNLDINISSTLYCQLKGEYKRVYQEIYETEAIHIETYYQAWLLRGDNPQRYYNEYIETDNYQFWDSCALNHYSKEMDSARKNESVREAVRKYHYDAEAKLRGSQSGEFPVFLGYAAMVDQIQKKMRFDIAKRHIAIETNPTSNYVIGTFKRYADHPMLMFNNSSLHNDSSKFQDNPQLSVSISTDDQGVFSTYVENEYALMAIALEKEVDENGVALYNKRFIYDYLDQIRRMGYEQRFKK